jgi:hypothetical protein
VEEKVVASVQKVEEKKVSKHAKRRAKKKQGGGEGEGETQQE